MVWLTLADLFGEHFHEPDITLELFEGKVKFHWPLELPFNLFAQASMAQ